MKQVSNFNFGGERVNYRHALSVNKHLDPDEVLQRISEIQVILCTFRILFVQANLWM